jgi:hypothetical protein
MNVSFVKTREYFLRCRAAQLAVNYPITMEGQVLVMLLEVVLLQDLPKFCQKVDGFWLGLDARFQQRSQLPYYFVLHLDSSEAKLSSLSRLRLQQDRPEP